MSFQHPFLQALEVPGVQIEKVIASEFQPGEGRTWQRGLSPCEMTALSPAVQRLCGLTQGRAGDLSLLLLQLKTRCKWQHKKIQSRAQNESHCWGCLCAPQTLVAGWDRHNCGFSRAVVSWLLWDTEGVGSYSHRPVTEEHLLLSSVDRDTPGHLKPKPRLGVSAWRCRKDHSFPRMTDVIEEGFSHVVKVSLCDCCSNFLQNKRAEQLQNERSLHVILLLLFHLCADSGQVQSYCKLWLDALNVTARV